MGDQWPARRRIAVGNGHWPDFARGLWCGHGHQGDVAVATTAAVTVATKVAVATRMAVANRRRTAPHGGRLTGRPPGSPCGRVSIHDPPGGVAARPVWCCLMRRPARWGASPKSERRGRRTGYPGRWARTVPSDRVRCEQVDLDRPVLGVGVLVTVCSLSSCVRVR